MVKFHNSSKYERMKGCEIDQINEARRSIGLEVISTKVRTCLRCSTEFVSQGDHNRLCDYCRRFNLVEFI